MIGECHRFLSQDSSAVKLIAWLPSTTSVFGLGWRNAELASWIFHKFYFFMMKLCSWRKIGLWNHAFSVPSGCKIWGKVVWQQNPASPVQEKDTQHNLDAAGHWGNELTPCDTLLQGFSSLEKESTNVYSKLFPGKKYKNKILPKSHILIWFWFTLFIPSDGKFLHRTEKCIYLSKNSGWRCSSPPLNWPCLSLVGRPNLSVSYNDQACVTLL